MRRLILVLLFAAAAAPGRADEFTDTIESALDAYSKRDITTALDDLEYATRLLNNMKAESLAAFLPAPQAGWTREEEEDPESAAAGMAMFGGGNVASATYTRGAESFTITLVANSPMVGGLGAMLTGMSSLAGGDPIRIQRTEFAENEGELQGVVDGEVLVSVGGDAPLVDKRAHLETMDFEALADF